jgi:hypothetical protein
MLARYAHSRSRIGLTVPSFTFWSPTALSNCGHFLYKLSHIDVRKSKVRGN